MWEALTPYHFHGLWSAITNTDTSSLCARWQFQTLSPHVAEFAFDKSVMSYLFWAAAFAHERTSHPVAFGRLSWWHLHSLSQANVAVWAAVSYPVSWWVNFLQVEVFWVRVLDCSLCVCELLPLGGVSLNSFHATGIGVGPQVGRILGSVIWRILWVQVIYLLLLSESSV